MKYKVKIKSNGTLEFLGLPPPTLPLPGGMARVRFSEIVPDDYWLRLAFRLLRYLFGEVGAVSDWTRGWSCYWQCVILRGPARGMMWKSWERSFLLEWEEGIWRRN